MMPSASVRRPSSRTARTPTCASSCWRCTPRSSGRCRTCSGRSPMLRIAKLAIAAALIALPAAADNYEQDVNRTLTYQGGRVEIDHRFGRVTLRAKKTDSVTVHGEIRASDPDLGRRIQIYISEATAGGVLIRTDIPSIRSHGGQMSYSVNLEVTIPERAPLLLKNRFGSTDVSGLRAPG